MKNKKSFTLIEVIVSALLVSVCLVAIMAALASISRSSVFASVAGHKILDYQNSFQEIELKEIINDTKLNIMADEKAVYQSDPNGEERYLVLRFDKSEQILGARTMESLMYIMGIEDEKE